MADSDRSGGLVDHDPRTPGSGPTPTAVQRQDGVGVPDSLARLWTPHRMAYVSGNAPTADASGVPVCPFCRIPSLTDAEGLIVARGDLVYACLNLYPYNPGHLLVVPYRHLADYTDLNEAELVEFTEFTRRALTVIRSASGPHGFNVGINLGAAAGAGSAAHLHQHVVPRWGGDANFMPVVAQTKVLPQLLGTTRELLADAWQG
jgi:ATP adenylyltransferase